MARMLALVYGAIAYVVFVASFLYTVPWLGNFAVPKTIDSAGDTPAGAAVLIDLLLLAAFAVQHSVMARPAFKAWWTRIVPPAIERSTYVLASSLLLLATCFGWQSLPGIVWRTEGPLAMLLAAGFWTGWAIVLASTFMISHFDLFGLRQVWLNARGAAYVPPRYVERFLYRFVRHPIMLGFIVAFWSAPVMSIGHLLFAAVTTAYIMVALQLEESDLVRELGAAYAGYRERVPMLVPGMKGRRRPTSPA